jgi:orotate phosphoribosyltransferase
MPGQSTQQATRRILESSGTLIENDHFVYASGDHGAGWVAKDLINLRPELAYQLGQLLGREIQKYGLQPDVVCGPAIGGVICAQYTALALGSRCVFAERVVNKKGETIKFEIKRGYQEILKNQSVLIVDDIVNTGFSVRLTYEAVKHAGAQPLGVAAYVNRGNVGASELGVRHFIFLDEILLPAWPAGECPLCQSSKPINIQYAHGAEFVNHHSPTQTI